MLANDDTLFNNYPTQYGGAPDALEHLFFQWGDAHVTVPIAAKQLRKYLTTGECPRDWALENLQSVLNIQLIIQPVKQGI